MVPGVWAGECSAQRGGVGWLPTAAYPFVQVWSFGADRGVVAVAGEHDRLRWKSEQAPIDRFDDGVEAAMIEMGCTRSAGEQGVTAEDQGFVDQAEADRSRCVARRGDRVKLEAADVDLFVVFQDVVVAGEHLGVGGGNTHLIAGVPNLGYGLDVVPVAVGFKDGSNTEGLGQLKQHFVFVGGVQQDRVAGLAAPDYEHIVVVWADDNLVNLGIGVGPVKCLSHIDHPLTLLALRLVGELFAWVALGARSDEACRSHQFGGVRLSKAASSVEVVQQVSLWLGSWKSEDG